MPQTLTDYKLLMWLQSLHDAVHDVKHSCLGNVINQFITNLNKAYTIHVKTKLVYYLRMETEVIKIAKQMLDAGIFQQMNVL